MGGRSQRRLAAYIALGVVSRVVARPRAAAIISDHVGSFSIAAADQTVGGPQLELHTRNVADGGLVWGGGAAGSAGTMRMRLPNADGDGGPDESGWRSQSSPQRSRRSSWRPERRGRRDATSMINDVDETRRSSDSRLQLAVARHAACRLPQKRNLELCASTYGGITPVGGTLYALNCIAIRQVATRA